MINQKILAKFKNWLENQGAEIHPPTNEWEALRFKGSNGVGLIHVNKKGRLNITTVAAKQAFFAFSEGVAWDGKPRKLRGRTKQEKSIVNRLLKRDGDKCFYCLYPLGNNVTKEHLVPISHNGPDRIDNMVLAHSQCNNSMGSKSIIEKLKHREFNLEMRWHGKHD